MSTGTSNTTTVVWTKEQCTETVRKCETKSEFKERFPEAAEAIRVAKWNYLYGDNFLGTDPQPDTSTSKEDTPPPPKAEKDTVPKVRAFPMTEKQATSPPRKKTIAKIYKLKTHQPLSFTLNVGRSKKLIVWDEGSQSNRAIRHCPNERTIYLDEQNKDTAVIEPIVFIKGFYRTTEKEEYTQRFLEMSPKFNVKFELINAEVSANKLVNKEDIIIDIKQAIRDKSRTEVGIEAVRAIVSVLTNNPAGAAKMTAPEVRYAAYKEVDTNLHRFIDDDENITIFDDDDIQRKALTQHAFLSGKIKASVDGRQIMWSDNNAQICSVPPGLDHLAVFADYLGTSEGVTVARELTKR